MIDWDPDIVETLDDDFKGHDLVFHLNEADDEEGGIEDDLDKLLAEAKQVICNLRIDSFHIWLQV